MHKKKRKENSDTSLPTVPATCLNKRKIIKRILGIWTQLHLQEQFKQVVSHPYSPCKTMMRESKPSVTRLLHPGLSSRGYRLQPSGVCAGPQDMLGEQTAPAALAVGPLCPQEKKEMIAHILSDKPESAFLWTGEDPIYPGVVLVGLGEKGLSRSVSSSQTLLFL